MVTAKSPWRQFARLDPESDVKVLEGDFLHDSEETKRT